MKFYLLIVCLVSLILLPSIALAGGPCRDGSCDWQAQPRGDHGRWIKTVEVQAYAEVAEVRHPIVNTVGKSANAAVRVAALPLRAVGKLAKAIHNREHKPLLSAAKGVGKLVAVRRR